MLNRQNDDRRDNVLGYCGRKNVSLSISAQNTSRAHLLEHGTGGNLVGCVQFPRSIGRENGSWPAWPCVTRDPSAGAVTLATEVNDFFPPTPTKVLILLYIQQPFRSFSWGRNCGLDPGHRKFPANHSIAKTPSAIQ